MRGKGIIDSGRDSEKRTSDWKPPWGYTLTTYTVDGVPIETVTKKSGNSDRLVLILHGGAYVIGLVDLYRDLAVRYSKISRNAAVMLVDYRIAPEFTFPAALEDAEKAWNWLLARGYKEENIIIAGDSAGGNLALALVMKLRDEDRDLPKAMILMSPWADMTASGESYRENLFKDPMFGKKTWVVRKPAESGATRTYAGNHPLDDPYLSPVYGEFHRFPPMLIQVGTEEILESDAKTVYEKAKAAGVDVTLSRYEGMFHVFQIFGDFIPEVRQAWEEVGDFLRWQFRRGK
jgi:acetyl esterase/lipase